MADASGREEYEQAARFRDQLQAARRALESQEMVLVQPESLDVVGLAEDDLEAAFQVFYVRGGRVLGRKGWIVDRVEDLDRPELVASFLRELYMEREEVPPRVLVPTEPRGPRGARDVAVGPARLPRHDRGARPRREATADGGRDQRTRRRRSIRHKLRRASDFAARSRALSELAEKLGLEQRTAADRVLRHLQPRARSDTVGSMVVFEDGLPKRSRLPPVRDQGRPRTGRLRQHGGDAPASVRSTAEGEGHAPRGQAAAVRLSAVARRGGRRPRTARASRRRSSRTSGSTSRAIGLAKRLEEVYFPGQPDPLADRARLGGALRLAARPRRGPPLRDHLPPAAARAPGAGVTARRDPRRRPGPQARAAEAVRLADQDPSGARQRSIAATPGVGPPLADEIHRTAARRRGLRPAGSSRVTARAAKRAETPEAPPRRPAFLFITGPLRRRPFRGRAEPRGPRVLRRGQPAAGAAPQDGRARREPRRTRPRRDRGRRARRRVLRRALQGPRGAPRAARPVRGSSSSRPRTTISSTGTRRPAGVIRSPRPTGWSRGSARSG